jgi:hypothetical protein
MSQLEKKSDNIALVEECFGNIDTFLTNFRFDRKYLGENYIAKKLSYFQAKHGFRKKPKLSVAEKDLMLIMQYFKKQHQIDLYQIQHQPICIKTMRKPGRPSTKHGFNYTTTTTVEQECLNLNLNSLSNLYEK